MIETVGVIGGGQLGRMLTQAAIPLGFEVNVIDPSSNCPAAQVGAHQIEAPLDDTVAIKELAESVDVVTWEIEHIPANYLETLHEEGYDVEPSPTTLSIIQDKLLQKKFLQSYGIPVVPFVESINESTLLEGFRYIVKTRKGGYDGRGNLVIDGYDSHRISEYFGEQPVYAELAVNFEKELSVIAARDKSGNIVTYPVVETIHQDNICHIVIAPAEVEAEVSGQANEIAHETIQHLEGAGVFAIEMFVVDGQVFVNEIAPRVHNSGHHTIEANVTSQFEQHIRAITGMPLGSTALRSEVAVMINILGSRTEPLNREGLQKVLGFPNVHPHFYGKSARPARKIGHITVLSNSIEKAKQTAVQARKELSI